MAILFGMSMKPRMHAAKYNSIAPLTPDSSIITATKRELIANNVSSIPGTKDPANINIKVRARHIPPSASLKVLFFFISLSPW